MSEYKSPSRGRIARSLRKVIQHILLQFSENIWGFMKNIRIIIMPHTTVMAGYVTAQMEPSCLSAFQVQVVKRTGDTGSNPEQASV
jgi:hypothetical protein